MSDIDETRRREERGKRIAVVIFLIALVVFGFVWFSR
jgi:dolichyl-phosphate-mannose--protein O-mannosyl transferase